LRSPNLSKYRRSDFNVGPRGPRLGGPKQWSFNFGPPCTARHATSDNCFHKCFIDAIMVVASDGATASGYQELLSTKLKIKRQLFWATGRGPRPPPFVILVSVSAIVAYFGHDDDRILPRPNGICDQSFRLMGVACF